MFKVNSVNFFYNTKQILSDISFNINKGKLLSIIGPNGSGKTTLINLLNGMNEKYSGNIVYLDNCLKNYNVKERAKNFSIIGQSSKIDFPFTCSEIIVMGLNPHKTRFSSLTKEDADFIYDIMEKTDTLEFVDKLVTQISGGELQRVLLARALVQRPKVLFLDESFSAMDISYKMKCLRLIRRLIDTEGLTVISVMHDINTAYKFSDEVCILKDGNLIKMGDTKELLTTDVLKDIFDIEAEYIQDKGFLIN